MVSIYLLTILSMHIACICACPNQQHRYHISQGAPEGRARLCGARVETPPDAPAPSAGPVSGGRARARSLALLTGLATCTRSGQRGWAGDGSPHALLDSALAAEQSAGCRGEALEVWPWTSVPDRLVDERIRWATPGFTLSPARCAGGWGDSPLARVRTPGDGGPGQDDEACEGDLKARARP